MPLDLSTREHRVGWDECRTVRRDGLPASYYKGEARVMPSYLERYRQGECEQVWAELLALGSQIREQPLYADAQSVTHETMTRARANIEMLVPRLTTLGFRFAYPDRVFVPADEETRRLVAVAERRAGPMPLSLRAWCELVGEVNFMGSHPKLSTYLQSQGAQEIAQGYLFAFAKHGGSTPTTGDSLRQSFELSQRLLNEVTQRIKTGQPRSPELAAGVRASKEFLEQFQRPTALLGPDVDSDPLLVEPYFQDLEDDMYDGEEDEDANEAAMPESGPYEVMIAPDPVHKTNQSGGDPYTIRFPDPAVDAPIHGDENYGTFIEYLRTCFHWGGFPGLRASAKPPREELEYLTQGLSPL
jgi:hypothetical protein